MNRTSLLSFFVVAGATAVLLAGNAQSQSGVPKNQVVLQPTTPGTSQSGHLNVSGTAKAGQFVGGGSGLNNVDADKLDGLNSSAFLQEIPDVLDLESVQHGDPILRAVNQSNFLQSTGVMGATNSLSFGRGVFGVSLNTQGNSAAGYFDNNSVDGYGVYSRSSGLYGVYGLAEDNISTATGGFFLSTASGGIGVEGKTLGTSLTSYGGKFSAVGGPGIYSESTENTGVMGRSLGNGLTAYGGRFSAFGGPGVFSESTHNTGGHFVSLALGGTGLFGNADADTGSTIGVRGESRSPDGRAVVGVQTGLTGVTYGGWFRSDSSSGYGVYGRTNGDSGVFGETLAATGTNYGGRFESPSTAGRGVYGLGSVTTAGTVPYGVRGQASTTTDGFGVYAVGDMGASGVKPFRIDHPADPENKYLLHYSSESPFPQNFYNGNVTTDEKGYAWVELPDYFTEINTNFKYQLTVVSEDFAQAIVSKKIVGNRFQIRTNAPNIEVSWEVKADRNDARIQWKRPTDVMNKVGPERGKYQHPEYYGQPESMGMDVRLEKSQTSHSKKKANQK